MFVQAAPMSRMECYRHQYTRQPRMPTVRCAAGDKQSQSVGGAGNHHPIKLLQSACLGTFLAFALPSVASGAVTDEMVTVPRSKLERLLISELSTRVHTMDSQTLSKMMDVLLDSPELAAPSPSDAPRTSRGTTSSKVTSKEMPGVPEDETPPPTASTSSQQPIPSVPFTPSIPFSPFSPSVPSIPFTPSVPSIPSIPFSPSVPSTPFTPSVPSTPQIAFPPDQANSTSQDENQASNSRSQGSTSTSGRPNKEEDSSISVDALFARTEKPAEAKDQSKLQLPPDVLTPSSDRAAEAESVPPETKVTETIPPETKEKSSISRLSQTVEMTPLESASPNTNAAGATSTSTLQESVADPGSRLRTGQTSGDFDDDMTGQLLGIQIADRDSNPDNSTVAVVKYVIGRLMALVVLVGSSLDQVWPQALRLSMDIPMTEEVLRALLVAKGLLVVSSVAAVSFLAQRLSRAMRAMLAQIPLAQAVLSMFNSSPPAPAQLESAPSNPDKPSRNSDTSRTDTPSKAGVPSDVARGTNAVKSVNSDSDSDSSTDGSWLDSLFKGWPASVSEAPPAANPPTQQVQQVQPQQVKLVIRPDSDEVIPPPPTSTSDILDQSSDKVPRPAPSMQRRVGSLQAQRNGSDANRGNGSEQGSGTGTSVLWRRRGDDAEGNGSRDQKRRTLDLPSTDREFAAKFEAEAASRSVQSGGTNTLLWERSASRSRAPRGEISQRDRVQDDVEQGFRTSVDEGGRGRLDVNTSVQNSVTGLLDSSMYNATRNQQRGAYVAPVRARTDEAGSVLGRNGGVEVSTGDVVSGEVSSAAWKVASRSSGNGGSSADAGEVVSGNKDGRDRVVRVDPWQ